ncbi:hypothetical protein ACOME3_002770 [Neoechinorhynchus agilis]
MDGNTFIATSEIQRIVDQQKRAICRATGESIYTYLVVREHFLLHAQDGMCVARVNIETFDGSCCVILMTIRESTKGYIKGRFFHFIGRRWPARNNIDSVGLFAERSN